jgi:hypothetical protein
MGIRTKIGDLFSVPLDGRKAGLGIVASMWNSELYLILFKEVFEADAIPKNLDIKSLQPFIASSSLDAKIWHGHWPIIANSKNLEWVIQPTYKIKEPIGWVAESFDRKQRMRISDELAEGLKYRKCVAPVRLEKALKAHNGYVEWNPIYDELLYSTVLKFVTSVP